MSAHAHALAGRRILVVEDEYLLAMEAKRWLEETGVTVIGPAPSVDQALDLLEVDVPDAAMLDVNLGDGKTVYPLADRLRELDVLYLFGTGETKVSDVGGYSERPLLAKPYSKAEFIDALTDLTAKL